MNGVIMESLNQYLYAFVIEDNELVEVHSLYEWQQSLMNNIYRARVINTLPGMEAAFVDIGEAKNGYLPFDELAPQFDSEKHLKGGTHLLVQVKRDGTETKGPKLTCELTFPGKYMVYMPEVGDVFVSKKIAKDDRLPQMKDWIEDLRREDEGILLRTEGVSASHQELSSELNYLRKQWKFVEERKDFLPVPKKLFDGHHPLIELFNHMSSKEDIWLQLSEKEIFDAVEHIVPENVEIKIKPYDSIRYNTKWWKQFMTALSNRVPIEGGGEIVIDHTEAMTVIDVNSGSDVGSFNFEKTALDFNLKACEVIAREIRLRNLSGIIIIDFIQMGDVKAEETVIQELKTLFKRDNNPANVFSFTQLGLLELTRQRKTRTLFEQREHFKPWLSGNK